jgi:NAD(P)-dependent dehydrogenase (short-subunit alcohol dehydrogenase family)
MISRRGVSCSTGNVIAPDYIGFGHRAAPSPVDLPHHTVGPRGTPDEVAKAVVFLAYGDRGYITGIELFVDGGLAQI